MSHAGIPSRRGALLPALLLPGLLLTLGACTRSAPAPEAEQTAVPKELAQAQQQPTPPPGASLGTPLKDRVATLGLLNKRNNISRDIELKPGESQRIGDVVVRLAACERTAPWESPPETGAFVQMFVQDRPDADSQARWTRVFSGWLFKNSPSLNVVEHPVYDVWVKDCAMSFPGEDKPVEPSASPKRGDVKPAAPAATSAPAEPAAAASPSVTTDT